MTPRSKIIQIAPVLSEKGKVLVFCLTKDGDVFYKDMKGVNKELGNRPTKSLRPNK